MLLFGFSFAIVVLAWLGHSRTMGVLPVEVPYALLANIVLLFIVALEPYLFYVLESVQTAGLADAASVAYALDVGGMFLMQATLARLVVIEERVGLHGQRPLHPVTLERLRRVSKLNVIAGIVFIVSALPIFWVNTPIGYLRFYLWSSSFVTLVPVFAYRRRRTIITTSRPNATKQLGLRQQASQNLD